MDFFAPPGETFDPFALELTATKLKFVVRQGTASIRAADDLSPTHFRKFPENIRVTSRSISSRVAARPLLSNFS
jgi:hypothetical protein